MTDALARLLGVDPDSESTQIARRQIESDRHWLESMIEDRRAHHSPEEFATEIGVELDELTQFESDPLDFDLGFVRVYQLALGGLSQHNYFSSAHLRTSEYSAWAEQVSRLAPWRVKRTQAPVGLPARKVASVN